MSKRIRQTSKYLCRPWWGTSAGNGRPYQAKCYGCRKDQRSRRQSMHRSRGRRDAEFGNYTMVDIDSNDPNDEIDENLPLPLKYRPIQWSVDTCILLLKIGPIWRFLDPYIPLFKNFDRFGGSLGVCNPFEKLGPIQWYMKLCITISNSDRFSGPWIPATLFETCTDSTVRGSLSLIKRVFGRSSYDYPWIFLPSMDGLWIFSLNFITFWLPICSYWGQNGRTDKVKLWPL